MKKIYKKKSPIEKLTKHRIIDEKTGCWNWDGNLDKRGYGKIMVMVDGVQKTKLVHRYSYAIYNDIELNISDIICHQCHNRRCFNPAHLKNGSLKNNSFEQLRDWEEFKLKHKALVDEYYSMLDDIKETYLNWHRII
jgi:hypothetical protein